MKVVYIISDIDKALAFEWMALGLKNKVDLCFILIGQKGSRFSFFLKDNNIRHHEISTDNYPSRISKWLRLLAILWEEKPSIIHAHLWIANVLGLSAAFLLRIKKRIYTRHHATIHYREFPTGRKWDRLCNRMATHIVAISENVKEILINWDGADPNKIKLIHHGFDLDYFRLVSLQRIEALRLKYQLPEMVGPVVGVISRYLELKGLQYIIPAFRKIRESYPDAKLVLANAQGNYEESVKKMLQALPSNTFVEIKFEEDLAALYKLFDVFVHVPTDAHAEAFGQTYVEALAAGVPSVFTSSGIAPEFVSHKKNAWVVDFKDTDQITDGILTILSSTQLRDELKRNGLESIQRFSLDRYILALEKLYTT